MNAVTDLFQKLDEGKAGAFFGKLLLEWRGPSDWLFLQQPDPLSFLRWTGEQVLPETTPTDLGSIPKIFWNLTGLDPAYYAKSYVIHDYLFRTHNKRAGVPVDFDEANLILAEMLMTEFCPRERVLLVYEAVELGGRAHWGA